MPQKLTLIGTDYILYLTQYLGEKCSLHKLAFWIRVAGAFPAVILLTKINKINEQISVGIELAVLEAVTLTLLPCKTHLIIFNELR